MMRLTRIEMLMMKMLMLLMLMMVRRIVVMKEWHERQYEQLERQNSWIDSKQKSNQYLGLKSRTFYIETPSFHQLWYLWGRKW